MEVLIHLLIVLNITLAMALFVVKMAQMDRRHASDVRERQAYKSFFRSDR